MITAVTAFVPIPDHPRRKTSITGWQSRCWRCRTDSVAVRGGGYRALLAVPASVRRADSEFTHSVSDNPQKNSFGITSCRRKRPSGWWRLRWLIPWQTFLLDRLRHFSCPRRDQRHHKRVSEAGERTSRRSRSPGAGTRITPTTMTTVLAVLRRGDDRAA